MGPFHTIAEWIRENPGKTAGGIAGFVLGILIFTIGILKTLVILLLVVAGILIGKTRDDKVSIIDQITGLFRKNRD